MLDIPKQIMKGIEKYAAKSENPDATTLDLTKTWASGFNFGSGRMNTAHIILSIMPTFKNNSNVKRRLGL